MDFRRSAEGIPFLGTDFGRRVEKYWRREGNQLCLVAAAAFCGYRSGKMVIHEIGLTRAVRLACWSGLRLERAESLGVI